MPLTVGRRGGRHLHPSAMLSKKVPTCSLPHEQGDLNGHQVMGGTRGKPGTCPLLQRLPFPPTPAASDPAETTEV